MEKDRDRSKRKRLLCAAVCLVVIGLMICAGYILLQHIMGRRLQKTLEDYQDRISALSEEDVYNIQAMLDENPEEAIQELPGGILGTVTVPDLSIAVPLYLGSSQEELGKGACHLEETDLPAQCGDQNCVIIGHSGLSYMRIFDGLQNAAAGMEIHVQVLRTEYVYRIADVMICTPREMQEEIVEKEGRNLVTLITCTPVGINSHRIVVQGDYVRCEKK